MKGGVITYVQLMWTMDVGFSFRFFHLPFIPTGTKQKWQLFNTGVKKQLADSGFDIRI
jgi:hypothetical protein